MPHSTSASFDVRRRSLRSALTRAAVVRWTPTDFGRRAFAVCGPDVWNSLPSSHDFAFCISSFAQGSLFTGPPTHSVGGLTSNGRCVCHRRRRSSSATLPAGWTPGAWAVGRPTLHRGPARLRPVRATPCINWHFIMILLTLCDAQWVDSNVWMRTINVYI